MKGEGLCFQRRLCLFFTWLENDFFTSLVGVILVIFLLLDLVLLVLVILFGVVVVFVLILFGNEA